MKQKRLRFDMQIVDIAVKDCLFLYDVSPYIVRTEIRKLKFLGLYLPVRLFNFVVVATSQKEGIILHLLNYLKRKNLPTFLNKIIHVYLIKISFKS